MIAIVTLTTACTSLIGVDDVSLSPPDAAIPEPECNVSPEFDLVVSNPATTILSKRMSDGGPSLLFLLNTDAKPDALGLLLYDNMGGHDVLNKAGSYSLTPADTKLETCGICLAVYVDFDREEGTFAETFMALAQGSLTLTTASTTQLAGRMQGLKFRHVDISGSTTKEVNDGCFVTIDDVHFDMTYSGSGGSEALLGEVGARVLGHQL